MPNYPNRSVRQPEEDDEGEEENHAYNALMRDRRNGYRDRIVHRVPIVDRDPNEPIGGRRMSRRRASRRGESRRRASRRRASRRRASRRSRK